MEQNRCPGCMEIKNGAVCPHCGYEEQKQNEPHQLQTGTVLQDKYLVGRALGQGGFGITYLGWNRFLEKKVAIKEYYPSFFVERHTGFSTKVTCKTERMEEAFGENRLRFLREAKLLAKLESVPQIVSILDFFEANNTAYIVMEYLQGNDLKSYIRKRGGSLTPAETFSILRPVMAALVKVHEAGLVHRDISPDNIMLQFDGSVKLMDFGAARSVNNPGVEKELTQATQAIVKHGFAPMEQYSEKGSIGPWTDEYALCATMYYCMTGKVPENVHDRIMAEEDLDWDGIAGLTERQKQILRKGMAIWPKDRYRTIRELMDALFEQPKPAPQPKPVPGPEPTKVPPKPKPAKPRKSKKGLVAGLAAACAVLALVIILSTGTVPGKEPTVLSTEPFITATPTTDPPMTEFQQEPLRIENTPITISAEYSHTVGLKADGTVVAVGANKYGECEVSGWRDIVDVGGGYFHTVGLKADGTVVAVGYWEDGRCDVSGWKDIVAIGAGAYHTVGLKADGTVVAVGNNEVGQCNVSGWQDIVAISAGLGHTVGLKADGTVVAAGLNKSGQCAVSGWKDIVSISAGIWHTAGLKADGTVVAVGTNKYGECEVSGWRDIVAVSAGGGYTVGLKADGTVVAAGSNAEGESEVSGWSEIVAISAGYAHTVGLKADGTVVAIGWNGGGQCEVSEWKGIRLP